MILGFILMALLALGAITSIALPLWRPRRQAGVLVDESNLAVWRQEREEIVRDTNNGALTAEESQLALRELSERAAREMAADRGETLGPRHPARVLAVGLSLGILVLSAGLYALLGTPAALSPAALSQSEDRALGPTDPRVIEMVASLSKKLQDHPEDARGWALLGRSQMVLQHYPEAVAAYQHAVEGSAPDAQLLADYADALAMSQGRSLEGKPASLVQEALKVDPNNPKALELAGTVALSRGDPEAALVYWQRLRQQLPADSDDAREVDEALMTLRGRMKDGADARALKEGAPSASVAAASAAPAAPLRPGAAAKDISGQIDVLGTLAGQVALNDTVFVVARASNWNSGGPRMPLAVLRFTARELPRHFVLSDAQAMSPEAKLSDQTDVVIQARVSKSGQALPQPGDLESKPTTVKLGSNDLSLMIDQVVR